MIYHKTWQKAVMKEREFNKLTIHVTVCCCRKISDGHFDTAGLKTPAMKSSKNWTYAYLLECVLRLHFSILTQVRTLCLGKGAAHSGLCLLIPMNITKALLRRQIPRPTQCRQSLVEILFPSRLYLRYIRKHSAPSDKRAHHKRIPGRRVPGRGNSKYTVTRLLDTIWDITL